MVTDKNGVPLVHHDIVHVDNSGNHGFWRSYYALVIRDRFGKLMMVDDCGVAQIPKDCVLKVSHFPSTSHNLSKDVEHQYIRYLKTMMDNIQEEMLDFVEITNKAKAGVIDGRAKNVCEDNY